MENKTTLFNNIIQAINILKNRPNMSNKQRQGFEKNIDVLEKSKIHKIYSIGFEDGYKYAIQRLEKQRDLLTNKTK